MNVLYLSDFRGLKSQILVVDHALVAVFFIFNLLPPVQLFFIFVERVVLGGLDCSRKQLLTA